MMGRQKLKIDEKALLEMREEGKSIKEIAATFGISTVTASRRIAELKHRGFMTKYRGLQGLRLTETLFVLLEAIAQKNLSEAPLPDLVKAFCGLYKAEQRIRGKETLCLGGKLLDYLLEIEKERNESALNRML